MYPKNDIQLLKLLLTSTESALLNVCGNYLITKYGKHNVFAKKDFIYATGDIPILLVAHLDTVLSEKPHIWVTNNHSTWFGKDTGLGADDRAGVFAILKIIQSGRRPSVLFTTGEEIGGFGAMAFVKEFAEPPVPTKYVIEIDRRGKGQAVFYDCGNTKFMKYVESFGFTTQRGIFSDISFICPNWNVAGVNLSAGYYNEHTEFETLKTADLFYTIDRVKKMLDNADEAAFYEFEDLQKNKISYTKCRICGRIMPYFTATMVDKMPVCLECVDAFVDWCEVCGKPFLLGHEYQTMCEVCANVV